MKLVTLPNPFSIRKNLKFIFAVAFLLGSLLISNRSYSQVGTYEIIDAASVADISKYNDAMDAANFDQYRFQSKRRMINFSSGVKIELLSASEVDAKGLPIDKTKAMSDTYVLKNEPVFEVQSNGYIKANHTSTEKSAR